MPGQREKCITAMCKRDDGSRLRTLINSLVNESLDLDDNHARLYKQNNLNAIIAKYK
jgi:hypothetical protein